MQATVIGAGSWGTALALVLARNGHEVRIVGRESDALETLNARRENLRYLPGFVLPEGLRVESLDEAEPEPGLTVIAVPSAAVGDVVPVAREADAVVVASKGLGAGGLRPSETVRRSGLANPLVSLSGPNLAVELARGIPTVAVAAGAPGECETAAESVRDAFMCRSFRVYVTDDALGVELAGALKNVYAIAAGMSDGLGFGDNTKGALLARGLTEMARIGLAMGAKLETFIGIAGVGDLFATANSRLSRNYRVGLGLGQGRGLDSLLEEIGQVAEGVTTTAHGLELTKRLEVEAPIMEVVQGVMEGRYDVRSAVNSLMERAPKREGLGLPAKP
ncbi:MAG: NAD(P)-dependent glycerol-3-phosphate dehydrogenase [Fimbriimonadaceae bacterium]|nr:NAD(P)-dependent glycerol-3-phosphate dehydrogenase [Fimbriimonadaceae bacterium]QYK56272.1 MAG: NAD(P)-dependent glycerol-3-phosphate dehydrogenase [Fimbriimonadaceae bacterium]